MKEISRIKPQPEKKKKSCIMGVDIESRERGQS